MVTIAAWRVPRRGSTTSSKSSGSPGVPPWNAEGLKEQFEVYASGGAQMVTSGVKDVLDREPRDIDAFASDHVDSFKEKQ